MKKMIKLCLAVILTFASLQTWAQGFVENALLFSRTRPGGSARVQAMGGAQVSLGGDFSSALSNPAGLGMYNRSEFTFSPAINTYDVDAAHLGTTTNNSKSVFNIPGLSYVHHIPKERNGFLGGSFGISMTRINDFHTSFRYEGQDNATSMIDYFEERAQGYSINTVPGFSEIPLISFDFPEGLAYLGYLITPYNEDPNNTSPVAPDDYINYFSELDTVWNNGVEDIRSLTRNQKVDVKGAQYQWTIAYGGNFADRFFFGAALGITTLRYNYSTTYSESGFNFSAWPGYDPLNRFDLNETITIDGSGVNFTVGVIYRPVDYMQVGVSLVTPTWYQLSDTYNASIQTEWNIRSDEDVEGESIISEYSIATPMKVSTGATFFLGKYGFLTGDVEFVNYGKAKYSSDTPEVSFDPENNDIKYYYTNVVNYRAGVELRYNIFRLRGGYNVQKNPYKDSFDVDQEIKTTSFGAGLRLKKFYFDVAWLMSKGNSSFSPYALNNGSGPVASLENKMTSAMATFGFTF